MKMGYYIYDTKTGEIKITVSDMVNTDDLATRDEAIIKTDLPLKNKEGGDLLIDIVTSEPYYRPAAPAPYFKWVNGAWVLDEVLKDKHLEAAARSEIYFIMGRITDEINILKDSIDLGMANEEEHKRYDELRRARVLLNRWKYPEPVPVKHFELFNKK